MEHDSRFHNKDGSLTRYALSCGYLEAKTWPKGSRISEAEAYATLEQFAATNILRVFVSGRYARFDVYTGTDLKAARKALRALNLEAEHYKAEALYWHEIAAERRGMRLLEGED